MRPFISLVVVCLGMVVASVKAATPFAQQGPVLNETPPTPVSFTFDPSKNPFAVQGESPPANGTNKPPAKGENKRAALAQLQTDIQEIKQQVAKLVADSRPLSTVNIIKGSIMVIIVVGVVAGMYLGVRFTNRPPTPCP